MNTSFAIHCDPCFYAGTFNAGRPHLVTGWGETKAITLATEAEAHLLASMLNDTGTGPYELSHGQYAAPDYTVRTSTLPVRQTLAQAMRLMELQHDFNLDGTRIDVGALMFGAQS